MFGRRKETARVKTQEAPVEQVAPHEADVPVATEMTESLGTTALSGTRGFEPNENGILIPDGSAKVNMRSDTLVTDSRRFTMESVEANYQAEQERLNSPLEISELNTVLEIVEEDLSKKLAEYNNYNDVAYYDTKGDIAALGKLRKVINNQPDMYIERVDDPSEELSGSEKLGRVVNQYAKLVPENLNDSEKTYLASMGGAVKIPEDGVIHCEGYNGSILYYFARAEQMCKLLENAPKDVREKILETSGAEDISWLYSEPVVVDRSRSKIEEHEAAV